MNRTRILAAAPLAAALAAASLVGTLPSAQAATEVTVSGKPDALCTDPPDKWYVVAPLSTNSLMLTNTTDNNGVACAYTAGSGRKSIKPGQTSNWSSSSPQGVNAEYKCYGDDGKNITYANSYVGSSSTGYTYNVQPTNWNTKTKHWGGAVLWSVADYLKTSIQSSQYVRSCNGDDGVINAARLYPVSMTMSGLDAGTIGVPSTYSLAVSASYGGGSPVAGQAALMVSRDETVGNADDTLLAGGALVSGSLTVQTAFVTGSQASPVPLAPGTYYLYGFYAGTASATPVIPSSGWFKIATGLLPVTVSAPASPSVVGAAMAPHKVRSAPAPVSPRARYFTGVMGSAIVEASTERGGVLSVICPSGGVPTQVNINSSDPSVGIESLTLKRTRAGIRVKVDAPSGAATQVQAICRKAGASLDRDANLTYGSKDADEIDRARARSAVYAGMGDDIVVLTGEGSVADGGIGDDDITVSAKDGVGVGSFGDDVVRSVTAKRSLIIGGPGRDILVGGPGATIINAQDGKGGDMVSCLSSRNKVYRDRGDILTGPCTIL